MDTIISAPRINGCIVGLVQHVGNSIASALELLQVCTKPSISREDSSVVFMTSLWSVKMSYKPLKANCRKWLTMINMLCWCLRASITSWPNDAYNRQHTRPSVDRCRLFIAMLLSESMIINCVILTMAANFPELCIKIKLFSFREIPVKMPYPKFAFLLFRPNALLAAIRMCVWSSTEMLGVSGSKTNTPSFRHYM